VQTEGGDSVRGCTRVFELLLAIPHGLVGLITGSWPMERSERHRILSRLGSVS
jgi:hypothetical protein